MFPASLLKKPEGAPEPITEPWGIGPCCIHQILLGLGDRGTSRGTQHRKEKGQCWLTAGAGNPSTCCFFRLPVSLLGYHSLPAYFQLATLTASFLLAIRDLGLTLICRIPLRAIQLHSSDRFKSMKNTVAVQIALAP